MVKLSIRDLWGKHTEKKALKPQVRNMLMSLDGVYDTRKPEGPVQADEQQPDEPARDTAR